MRKALNIKLIMSGAAFVAALFVFSGDVMAQSSQELSNRLKRLENEVETMSRAIYRGEQPPPSMGGGSSANQANMEVRLQQLEMQLRELTGKVEETAYQNRQLNERLERMSSDMEMRLNALESGGRSSGGSNGGFYNGGSSSSSNGAVYNRPSDDDEADASSSDNTLGTLRMNANAGSNAGSTGDNAAAAYENAFSLLKAGNYSAAEREFDDFLRNHENHVLAGNAKYWLGETFYVRGDFERAARIFAEGYQKYPEGSKSADNLLKLGLSLSSIGNTKDACIALGQLEKDYPDGSGPVLRRAEQEKSKLGC